MKDKLTEKRSVTTAEIIEIMHKRGVKIDEKKAAEILDLIYFLAKLIVDQNFKK